MNLFNIFKKKEYIKKNYQKISDYYVAKPNFYEKDNEIVGICTLTDGVLTLLHKELNYTIKGKNVTNYQLAIFSTIDDKIITYLDYYKVLKILEKNAKGISDNYILVELNLQELKELINKCS